MTVLNNLSMIVAATEDGGIGGGNTLPWKCPEDMKFFKTFTTGKSIVMGWNTFASLNYRPLPNRDNYLLCGTGTEQFAGVKQYDYPCTQQIIKSNPDTEFVIIGGAKTYKLFMPYVKKAYVTTIKQVCVDDSVEIDTYMPELPADFSLQGVVQAHDTCTIRCFVRN